MSLTSEKAILRKLLPLIQEMQRTDMDAKAIFARLPGTANYYDCARALYIAGFPIYEIREVYEKDGMMGLPIDDILATLDNEVLHAAKLATEHKARGDDARITAKALHHNDFPPATIVHAMQIMSYFDHEISGGLRDCGVSVKELYKLGLEFATPITGGHAETIRPTTPDTPADDDMLQTDLPITMPVGSKYKHLLSDGHIRTGYEYAQRTKLPHLNMPLETYFADLAQQPGFSHSVKGDSIEYIREAIVALTRALQKGGLGKPEADKAKLQIESNLQRLDPAFDTKQRAEISTAIGKGAERGLHVARTCRG